MKKHFILGIMALAALASCDKSEVLNQESLDEKGITFSAYVGKAKQTKATTINATNAADAGIGLLAWRTGGEDVTEDILSETAPAFMKNLKLTLGALKTGSENVYTATYSPTRYWPSTGAKVSFYAYAPHSTGAGLGTNQSYTTPFNPENITFNLEAVGNVYSAHKLNLTVPMGDVNKTVKTDDNGTLAQINDGNAYKNQTDLLVARVGNGVTDTEGAYTGTDANGVAVGINQNLNKNHEGAVTLQMKHALSKIRFEARAGDPAATDATKKQNAPYSNVKVVFDHISVNGTFVQGGTYNLLTEQWESVGTAATAYSFFNNPATNDDAFNVIADSLWNYSAAPYEDAPEETYTAENGWYRLNKSSHDLMVIPVSDANSTAAKINTISGCYTVKTYQWKQKVVDNVPQVDGEGNPVMEEVEIPDYADPVYFRNEVNIDLVAGKEYIFRFDIKLKEITFEVVIEAWDPADPTEISYDNNGNNQTPPANDNNGQTGGDAGGPDDIE